MLGKVLQFNIKFSICNEREKQVKCDLKTVTQLCNRNKKMANKKKGIPVLEALKYEFCSITFMQKNIYNHLTTKCFVTGFEAYVHSSTTKSTFVAKI